VRKGSKNIRHLRDAWLYGTPRWVLAQTRQEACDRLETTVMRPPGTRENKQTNKCKKQDRFMYLRVNKTEKVCSLKAYNCAGFDDASFNCSS
jgi:hypothetical protein